MPRRRPAPRAIALAVLGACAVLAPRGAGAELLWDLSATLNGRGDVTESAAPRTTTTRVEVRPAGVLMLESPRLVWRGEYAYAGSYLVDGGSGGSHTHRAELSLAAEPGGRVRLTARAIGTRSSSFADRLTVQPADAAQPTLRSAADLPIVTTTARQDLEWDATEALRLTEVLEAARTSLERDLGRANLQVSASLRGEQVFKRDALGLTLSPRWSRLTALAGERRPYVEAVATSLTASWNRDIDWWWNVQLGLGAEQVQVLNRAGADQVHPTGSLSVRYFAGRAEGSLSASRGAVANLEAGTLTLTDQAVLRGVVNVGEGGQAAASAGFARSSPLTPGAAEVRALRADVSFTWIFLRDWLLAARYSLERESGPGIGPEPILVHAALVGITARWGNAPYLPPVPTLGSGRVDGGDRTDFPGAERDREQGPREPGGNP